MRCRKPLFFAVCTCRRFESHVLFHTDSPTCVFPCPRALYDAMASPEASWRTAEPRHGRGLPLERAGTAHAAFRPLDPTLIAQCFFLIGRRPVACSAIVLRLALREGRPISRARLLFYPAIRVDSPTSPAVACSVRRQLSRETTGARAHRSSVLSLAVLSYGWLRVLCFFASFSHLYHAESGLFPEFTSGGLQRPQTTFPSCW